MDPREQWVLVDRRDRSRLCSLHDSKAEAEAAMRPGGHYDLCCVHVISTEERRPIPAYRYSLSCADDGTIHHHQTFLAALTHATDLWRAGCHALVYDHDALLASASRGPNPTPLLDTSTWPTS